MLVFLEIDETGVEKRNPAEIRRGNGESGLKCMNNDDENSENWNSEVIYVQYI